MKRVFSILLCFCLIGSFIPNTAFAADTFSGIGPELHINYSVSGGDAAAVSFKEIGKYQFSTSGGFGRAFIAELPYGANITSTTVTYSLPDGVVAYGGSTEVAVFAKPKGGNTTNIPLPENYAIETDFKEGFATTDKTFVANPAQGYVSFNDGYTFPLQDVKGFAIRVRYKVSDISYADIFYIQIRIVEGESQAVDKTALLDAINTDVSGYYQNNDKWDGQTYVSAGFFSLYQTALTAAQTVYNAPNATQTDVDSTADALTAAIAKLIPKSEVNATNLYETIRDYTLPEDELEEKDYAERFLNRYQTALAEANDWLTKLFGADRATYNLAANQNTVDAAAQELIDAKEGLVTKGWLANIETYRAYMTQLNGMFPITDGTGYTEDSWSAFTAARDEAAAWLSQYPTENDIPSMAAIKAGRDAVTAYYNACYGLEQTGDIQVKLTVADNLGAAYPQYALKSSATSTFNGTVTLTDGAHSLSDLSSRFDWSEDMTGAGDMLSPMYLVYINGLLVRNPTGTQGASTEIGSPAKENTVVKLRNGDKVAILRVVKPQGDYYSWPANPDFDKVVNYLATLSFTTDPATVTAKEGESFNVGVQSVYGYFPTYTGRAQPAKGKQIIAYGPASTEDGEYPATPEATGAFTDNSGNASVKLYKAGWYTLTAVDTAPMLRADGAYPNLTGGATMRIYISPLEAGELAAALGEQKALLDDIYDKCDEGFLGTRWEQVEKLYKNTAAVINGASDLKTARDTVVVFESKISEHITAAAAENTQKVDHMSSLLKGLPTEEEVANSLFVRGDLTRFLQAYNLYAGMTDYQRSQLTVAQASQYTALEDAYFNSDFGANLPAVDTYNISLEFIGQNEDDPFAPFDTTYGNYVNTSQDIVPGSSASFNIRATSGKAAAELDYEIYDIQFLGENGKPLDESKTAVTYRGAYLFAYYGLEYYILYSAAVYNMPHEDVTVRVYARSKTSDLEGARSAAISALTASYQAYSKAKYSSDNWAELTSRYNSGLAAIAAATSIDAISSAKNAALAAMAEVETLQSMPTNPTVGTYGSVHVFIENTTYPEGAFTGQIVGEEGLYVPLEEDSTMMTCALDALNRSGFTWTGTGGSKGNVNDNTITYLASISREGETLGEFSGSAGSGWMGTLNDWFVNESFQSFKVSAGNKSYRLADGDEIRIMYTDDLGADLGGTWGNANTSLSTLSYTGGTMTPGFESGTLSYVLSLSSNNTSVSFTPTAANKNYQVRTYLNTKSGDNWYRRGEQINVKSGDVVYIGIGESSWPSMNNQGTEAISYTGTWYAVTIMDSGSAAGVITMINSLSTVTYSNYKTQAEKIALARAAYEALSSDAKQQISDEGYLAKLVLREGNVKYFEQIDSVKALLAAVPAVSKLKISDKSAVVAASDAYKAMDSEQQRYITVGDAVKYNAAIEWLKAQGVDTPDAIIGSDKQPSIGTVLTPAVTASNGKAELSVSESDLSKVISEAAKNDDSAILIVPEITGTAKKISVEIPKSSVSSIASETNADLTVETPVGSITIKNNTLASIASQASGGSICIVLENVEKSSLTTAQQTTVGESPVYDISLLSGGSHISSFGGGSITVSLPYTLKNGETGENVTVWYLNGEGKLEKMTCVYDKNTGMATFTTTHLSYYVVGYEKWVNPFADVKSGDWFYEAVKYVSLNTLMGGTSDKAFEPEASMTRAMLVTVLYRLEGKPAVTGSNGFADVSNGDWYSDAVIWASENKIASGYGNGLFGTNDKATREQMAAILYNYAKYKGSDVTNTKELSVYTDASDVSSWAQAAMKWAVAEGLIAGTTSTALSPAETATRAQAATILMRFADNILK